MNRHPAQIRRARAMVRGLVVEWEDCDPLAESSSVMMGTRTHENPVYRHRAVEIYEDYREWIYKRQQFMWQVTIHIDFELPDSTIVRDTLTLRQRCKLDVINQVAEKQIAACRLEMSITNPAAKYKTCFFKVKCEGN